VASRIERIGRGDCAARAPLLTVGRKKGGGGRADEGEGRENYHREDIGVVSGGQVRNQDRARDRCAEGRAEVGDAARKAGDLALQLFGEAGLHDVDRRGQGDGLIDHNPFSDLQLVHSDGRADDQVMPEAALHRLADAAIGALGPEHGPMWRTGVLFAAYVGPRAESFCALEWPDVDLAGRTVHFRVVKFDRPYTAILLPHVVDELRRLPRRTDLRSVFWSLRGQSLRKGSHFYAWDKVRQAGGMPDLDFHELRHWCGHHFYVTLGFSAEEAGAQLGHKDGRQIVQTYGHGRQGALQRLHRGAERPAEIRSTQTPRATEGEVG
jgi:integrase